MKAFLFIFLSPLLAPAASFFYTQLSTQRTRPKTRLHQAFESIRFLGRGSNAIVRPGVVLLAPSEEYHHFLRKAAVFIYAMGEDDNDEYVIRGVIIDHPTAFTMGEMAEDSTNELKAFNNILFRGGEFGGDSAFMLHSVDSLGKLTGSEAIGNSGIYQGGLEFALANNEPLDPEKVKFFFNYMEFTENELENMLEAHQTESDGWVAVEVPPELVLSSDYDRGDAWARLRNAINKF